MLGFPTRYRSRCFSCCLSSLDCFFGVAIMVSSFFEDIVSRKLATVFRLLSRSFLILAKPLRLSFLRFSQKQSCLSVRKPIRGRIPPSRGKIIGRTIRKQPSPISFFIFLDCCLRPRRIGFRRKTNLKKRKGEKNEKSSGLRKVQQRRAE